MTAALGHGRPARARSGWHYGAYRYGLEPLYLPPVFDAGRSRPSDRPPLAQEPGTPGRHGSDPADALLDPPTLDDLFWFRWITGHQVIFVLWRLMARVVGPAPPDVERSAETVRMAAVLAEGYSTMLMYASSCTPEAYERFIRPAMYRQHHGFSGLWAPDYAPVRRLFHGRGPAWLHRPDAQPLRDSIEVNQAVHAAVAARLVPGSESLLQQHAAALSIQDRGVCADLYDVFFLTIREPVSCEHIDAQLAHRLRACRYDIQNNGCYPVGRQGVEHPRQHRPSAVLDYAHRFAGVTAEIGDLSRLLTRPSREVAACRHQQSH